MNLFEFNTIIKIIAYIYENHLCMIYLAQKSSKINYRDSNLTVLKYERDTLAMSDFWDSIK